ncbi:MAG TPA: hypothetical protein VGB55_05245, partial [Tepidisphaeraceae bacterium]
MNRTITLDQVEIPKPCHADWQAMTGDDRRRFCGECGKHVHDLSALSRREAEQLINARAGKLCVQFSRTASGQIITQEHPPRRRAWAGLSAALACVLALVGCRRNDPPTTQQTPPGEAIIRTAGMVAVTETMLGDVVIGSSAPPVTRGEMVA